MIVAYCNKELKKKQRANKCVIRSKIHRLLMYGCCWAITGPLLLCMFTVKTVSVMLVFYFLKLKFMTW